MSGGSFNYLYCKETEDMFSDTAISDLSGMEDILLKTNYTDIAKDIRRLIEYIKSARNRVEVLQENLKPVLKAVEWYESCDIGADSLAKAVERYRTGGGYEDSTS